MTEFKETVTKSKDEGVDANTGAQVQQQTRKVSTEVTADSKSIAGNVVWYILGFIEILLAFRFVLKLLGANPDSGFVNLIYTITGILTAPFDNIFGVTTAKSGDVKSVFEPSILVALAVYALVAWGIVKLLHVNHTNTDAS
ncbi:MAG TPA: YggT family protein [Patescibacteria group bacterium]|nr:YggT family protein [Patescibacteria group bacterium]